MKEIKEEKKPVVENIANAGTVLEDTGMGEVKIHENVISALVRKAVMSVDGVARLSGSQLVDIIAETVGSRRMQDRAIAVTLEENNRVAIEIKVNILVGFRLPEVAENIQRAIIDDIEAVTGMTVTRVNVLIQQVEEEIDDDAELAIQEELPLP